MLPQTQIIINALQKGTATVGNGEERAYGWGDCKPDVGRRPEVHGLGALLEHVNVRLLNIAIIFSTQLSRENVKQFTKLRNFCFSAAPIQMALCVWLMYEEIGYAAFAGLAVLIVSLPLNAGVSGFLRTYQIDQMKQKDGRVKLMNEILGGIKVLKLYAWEKSFIKQILDIRDNSNRFSRK